jgi:hypothetical protein
VQSLVRVARLEKGRLCLGRLARLLLLPEVAVLGGEPGAALVQGQGLAEEFDGFDVAGKGKTCGSATGWSTDTAKHGLVRKL